MVNCRLLHVSGCLVSMSLLATACGTQNKNPFHLANSSNQNRPQNSSEDNLALESLSHSGGRAEPWFIAPQPEKSSLNVSVPANFETAIKAFRRLNVKPLNEVCAGTLVYTPSGRERYDIHLLTARHCMFSLNPLGMAQAATKVLPVASPVSSPAARTQQRASLPSVVTGLAPTPALDISVSTAPERVILESKRQDKLSLQSGRLVAYNVVDKANWQQLTNLPFQRLKNSDVVRIKLESGLTLEQASAKALPVCANVPQPGLSEILGEQSTNVRILLGLSKNDSVTSHRLIGAISNRKDQIGRYGFEPNVLDFLEATSNAQTTSTSVPGVPRFAYSALGNAHAVAMDSGSPVILARHSYNKMKAINPKRSATDVEQYVVESFDCVSDILVREFWSIQVHGSQFEAEGSMVFVNVGSAPELWE